MAQRSRSGERRSSVPRLSRSRPVLDRVIFAVALLGLLVAAHLYIQQGRGFDRGCLGFSAPTTAVADCEVVAQSDASTLFGVSNAVWGVVFYAVVAALSFLILLVRSTTQRRAKWVRVLLVTGGFLYAAYLFYYQAAVVGDYCVLCVTSAAIELVLLLLVGADLFDIRLLSTTRKTPMKSPSIMREATTMGGLALLVLLLVGADFVYFNSLEVEGGLEPVASLDLEAEPVADLSSEADDECGYDPEKEPVEDYMKLVGALDPYTGNADAPVTVIEYFDPNCPHCKTLQPIMDRVIEEYGDEAHFVYKPVPLWQRSVAQVQAMQAAAQEGKFFEMMNRQFELQSPQGMNLEQLQAIADDIGMNPETMTSRMEAGLYNSIIMTDRKEAFDRGIQSMPTVLINGRVVGSRSAECIGQLIEEAAEGNQ